MDVLNLREPFSAWSHGAWLLLTMPAAVLLWRRARGDRPRQLVMLGYATCLALCASASTLYHGVRLPEERLAVFLLLDHAGIYVLIAGTYAPIGWLMKGRARGRTLTLSWLAAGAGIALNVTIGDLPYGAGTLLYLAMGWGSIFCYRELSRTYSHRTLSPIILGGILYSVGAAFHLLGWPVAWPGVFEGHELFHLFVVAGSAAHYGFVYRVVAPCRPPAVIAREEPAPRVAKAA